MRPEQALWRKVSRYLGPVVHAVRIEASNGEAENGTPDVCIAYKNRMRWWELKVWPEPLRPSQRAWAMMHDQRGCDQVLVLCEIPQERKLYLMPWRVYDAANQHLDYRAIADRCIWVGVASRVGDALSLL